MDYTDFCKTFHQVNKSVFEKEEDSVEWNAKLKQLNVTKTFVPSCLIDNAAHYSKIATYPHYKHVGGETIAQASDVQNLFEILTFIRSSIFK